MTYKDSIFSVATADLPWEKLSGCNILVTGASGLIGSCLIEVLLSHPQIDYYVYASCRNIEKARNLFKDFLLHPAFNLLQYDVQNTLCCDINFHYIVHAASNASPNFFALKPVEVIKSNILGVSNLIEYGISHSMKRFLYVSTGEVYGEGNVMSFSEDYSGYVDCTKSRSCYPSSKRASENLCVCYGVEYGADVVIARPSHVYGPNFSEEDNRVYAQFIRNVINDEDIVLKSRGEQFRSWCYVTDCVLALLYILLKGVNNNAYNIADNSSNITIKDLAHMVASISGKSVKFELPSDLEKAGFNIVTQSLFDTSKLESLGWSIYGSMHDKLLATINHLKSK